MNESAMILQGLWSGDELAVRHGSRLASVGLVLFGAGVVFFELVLSLSGFGNSYVSGVALPSLLIAIGVYLLARRGVR